jgi:hypothetical protein
MGCGVLGLRGIRAAGHDKKSRERKAEMRARLSGTIDVKRIVRSLINVYLLFQFDCTIQTLFNALPPPIHENTIQDPLPW